MPKYKFIYQLLLVVLLTPVILFALWGGNKIHELTAARSVLKKDYSELNNIQYGLLSVTRWRDHVSDIVSEQIDAFDLSSIQEDSLRTELNKVLNSVISRANNMINAKQTRLDKRVKQFAIKKFVDIDEVRGRVPQFSQTIIDELKKPDSKQRLKFLAKDKFREFADKTHDSISDYSSYDSLLKKYNAPDVKTFNTIVLAQSQTLQDESYHYTFLLAGCLVFFLLLWIPFRNQKHLYKPFFVMSIIMALITLFVGLSAPMIEIDARIKELNFLLVGKSLVFNDQVIFYQSKSIMDVVHILIATGKADSIFVGMLILVFSIVFPVTKLICTQIYLLGGEKVRSMKLINFFAFKSGKWSMADVMVVAIFMAYIGFNGILNSQMENLNIRTDHIASVATNETSLQPGVILFICYVIYGLILGAILKNITFDTKFIDVSKLRFRKHKAVVQTNAPEMNDNLKPKL